ncbi:Methyltransferase domain-containing protein [Paenibacillus sp. UNCCL117]|uniref:class I SAM-dependent methyltransferase n=1 Tax=unclassified Paenibacillus TaxID=185978 RepID=UPI00087F6010|nr:MULTISPECIES: class I SAM-dependent methyltransferase [unclassified Paenibacillus]SDE48952.1 Methyltransferase domain-containing protein [Paenibacillus sp. cl123]SFW66779.1 Methyltransferase domain-containing protein [Paenibacillus sp. UNCCL117]
MAIVQLRSTNPQFSFLIKKNPGSGMMLRSIRKGMTYGWYTDEQIYNVYFKDADNDISYKQHEQENFEYLNVSRYNTPLFPLNAINEFFSATLKAQDERDVDGYEHTFFINMIHIELLRYIEFFEKHLKDVSFEISHQAHKSYSLTVTTKKSLYHLLHVVSVLCLFLSIFGNEYMDISDSILDKYIKSMNVIDAPFYIRSLFVRNFLSSRDRFHKYKGELERTERYHIQFAYGGTGLQRRNYIGGALAFDKSILDVGCGEGFYALPFAGKIEGNYYAIDINEELLAKVKRKAEAKELENIITFESIDRFLESYNGELVDVILTEVIEHMSQDEARQLIGQICAHVDFDKFIITTPNADFNRYYELDDFRHVDHKWEMGEHSFQQWMSDVIKETNLQAEFVAVGDGVNNIQTTQGVILKRRGA